MERAVIGYFEKERARVDELLAQAPAEAWQARRDDGWSAVEVLSHMVSATDMFIELARRALAGQARPDPSFDVDAFNAEQRTGYAALGPEEVQQQWRELAERTLRFMQELPDESWGLPATTPFGFGKTVEDVLGAATFHLRSHRQELQAIFSL